MHNDDYPEDDVDTDVLTSAGPASDHAGPGRNATPGHGPVHPKKNTDTSKSKGPKHSLKPSGTGGMQAVEGPNSGAFGTRERPNTGGRPARDTGGQAAQNAGGQSRDPSGAMPQQRPFDTGPHRPNTGPNQQPQSTGPMQQTPGRSGFDTGSMQQRGDTGAGPQQQRDPSGAMARPDTGGREQTDGVQGFRKDTSGFVPVKPKRAEPEIDVQLRIIYAGSGFGIGLMLGVGLGLLNSALEGVDPVQGLGLTLQIAVWLGLIIGIVAGWKPRRFDNAWDRLMSGLGLGD